MKHIVNNKTPNATPFRVLIYGGFEKVNRELPARLSDCKLHFLPATRKHIDMSGAVHYDLIASFKTKTSHSGFDYVFATAKKRGVKCLKLRSSGAQSAADEIKRALCA